MKKIAKEDENKHYILTYSKDVKMLYLSWAKNFRP